MHAALLSLYVFRRDLLGLPLRSDTRFLQRVRGNFCGIQRHEEAAKPCDGYVQGVDSSACQARQKVEMVGWVGKFKVPAMHNISPICAGIFSNFCVFMFFELNELYLLGVVVSKSTLNSFFLDNSFNFSTIE